MIYDQAAKLPEDERKKLFTAGGQGNSREPEGDRSDHRRDSARAGGGRDGRDGRAARSSRLREQAGRAGQVRYRVAGSYLRYSILSNWTAFRQKTRLTKLWPGLVSEKCVQSVIGSHKNAPVDGNGGLETTD